MGTLTGVWVLRIALYLPFILSNEFSFLVYFLSSSVYKVDELDGSEVVSVTTSVSSCLLFSQIKTDNEFLL